MRKKIKFGCIHCGNKSDDKPLIIIPGFSDKSFGWTVGRIDSNKELLLTKYTYIYIIDNSSIDKTPNILEKDYGIEQYKTYIEIAKIYNHLLKSIVENNNFSVLGRSAGGGIAMMLSLGEIGEKINEMYLAAPRYSYEFMKDQDLTKMPSKLVVSHSLNDQKIDIQESINLCRLFKNKDNLSIDFIVTTNISDIDGSDGWLNHRITKDLIEYMIKN